MLRSTILIHSNYTKIPLLDKENLILLLSIFRKNKRIVLQK